MDRERRLDVARAAQDNDVEQDAAPDRMRQAAMVKRKATAPTSGGSALDGGLRAKMEKSLGSDLSGVRLHTDAEAGERSKDLGARAYTEGADVHFASGEFNPGTKEGDRLIAHELTHVVQGGAGSGGGAAAQAKSAGSGGGAAAHRKEVEGGEGEEESAEVEVSDPEESAEKEADAVADQAVDEQHEGKESEGEQAAEGEMGAAEKKDEPPKIQAKLDGAARKVNRKVGADAMPGADVGKMKEFENALGLRAMNNGKAQGAAQGMVSNIYSLLKAEADVKDRKTEENQAKKAKLDQLLSDFTGTERKGVAGAVGKSANVLDQVMTGGNLREQLTVVFNFSAKFPDLVMGKTSEEREQLFAKSEVKDKGDALEARLEEMVEKKKAKLVANPDGETDGSFEKTQKGRNPGDPNTFPAVTDASEAEGMQKQARQSNVPNPTKTENPKVQDVKDDSLEKGKEDKSKISERELAFMGQEGKAVEDQVTDWAMGINAHTENKESEFSKDLAALKLPFGAGPSGTTSRICDTSRLLGIEPDTNTRLACIGYLLPIHAHSMWEIVDGAATQGVDGIDWRNLGVNAYEEIKPFSKEEVRSLKESYGIPSGADAEPEAPVGGAGAGAASDDDDGTG